MNARSDLYPEPPHIEAAFYMDLLSPRDGLARLCQQIARAGCAPTGAIELVRGAAPPVFASLSDLSDRLERLQLPPRHAERELGRLLDDPQVHVMRAGFSSARGDLVVAGFTPAAVASESLHPVAATLSGTALCIPGEERRSRSERQKAQHLAHWVRQLFRGTCEGTDPFYAAIAVEAYLPTPRLLLQEGARLSTELFLSARLLGADLGLERDLEAIFAGGLSERWATGVFLCGWPEFYPPEAQDRPGVAAPLQAGALAAQRLASALRRTLRA